MKKLFTLFLAFVASAGILFADEAVKIGELYYYLNNSNWTAEVTNNGRGTNYELGTITIPSSVSYLYYTYAVTSIGEAAFNECYNLTSVTIPNSVTSIGEAAFSKCINLTSVTIPNSVTSIGETAFSECYNLTSVTIPNSVTSIGNFAFLDCWSLTSISIPNSVTSIGSYAFSDCTGLTSITISNSVTSIEESTFSDCSSLTSVTIPNSVTDIGVGAFMGCSSLQSIEIPNSVTSIGEVTFFDCSSLTSVIIPNSVTNIGEDAFAFCNSLESIVVETGNVVYDNRDNCNAIIETATNKLIIGCQSTTIPNSVTSIGNWAFWGCSGLISITIPSSLTSIGSGAFSGCSGLMSISVEAGNSVYDSRDNCNAIIETATNTLFLGCKGTTIPSSVTSIGNFAFGGCRGLISITIPSSLTSIGYGAFSDCSNLTTITCNAETPPSLGSAVFRDLNCATISLYVPAQSVDAYKAADQWKDFNVQAISEDALPEILTGENALDDKFIIDGVLYIRKDGRVYDLNGIIVE